MMMQINLLSKFSCVLLFSACVVNPLLSDKTYIDKHNVNVAENRLTEQILSILEHYKQDDPIGLPGIPIPDPLTVPDMSNTISFTTVNMTNIQVYGLSKFRIKYIKTDLQKLRVEASLQIDDMNIFGNYTMKMFFSNSNGPFTVVMKNVFCQGNATLAVEMDGKIRSQLIEMDMSFSNMSMNFENLGALGNTFQNMINKSPNIVFDSIKPFMLVEAANQMKEEIDKNLENVMDDHSFPNSISPLDMAIAEARKKVRKMGYDPFHLPDYDQSIGVFGIEMSNTWVTGASSFYRVGDILLTMENNIATMYLQIGTQRLYGSLEWAASIGFITRAGHATFSIDEFIITLEVSQPLDTRKPSELKDLQLQLGNIQVHCEGAGTLDYIIEILINILPNLIRYQLMDAIEGPLKRRIQEKMNKFYVEDFIKTNVTQFLSGNADFNLDFKFELPKF